MAEGGVTQESVRDIVIDGDRDGVDGAGGLPEKTLKERIAELWDAVAKEEPATLEQEQRYLNWAFDKIPVSLFPKLPSRKVIEIRSDASIPEAVQTLSDHNILSAPVRDVSVPEDLSWMDKYIGMVDFSSIVMWVLEQASTSAAGNGAERKQQQEREEAVIGKDAAAADADEHGTNLDSVDSAPSGHCSRGKDFYEAIRENEDFQKTQVSSIAGCFRWAPFLPVESSDTLLTLLLLLSKYHIKSIPVVEAGQSNIHNFITQSSVGALLAECSGLHWFDHVADRSLVEHKLPLKSADELVKIDADQPVLEAFKIMEKHLVGAVPIVEGCEGHKIIGNVSARDIRFLLMEPDVLDKQSDLTVRQMMEKVKGLHPNVKRQDSVSKVIMSPPITCGREETLKNVIQILADYHIHRVYVTEDDGTLAGVVTIRDIISRFVTEPENYFGNFFTRVIPSFPSRTSNADEHLSDC